MYDPDSALDRAKLARELIARLTAAGFAVAPKRGRGEQVWTRAVDYLADRETGRRVPLEGVSVEVYTTIVEAGHGLEVRALGKDAIRVCAVHRYQDADGKTKSRGLAKEARVFRTGEIEAIVERTIVRARKVWAATLDRPRCDRCGCVTFTSRKGNDVCARVCFAQREGVNMHHAG